MFPTPCKLKLWRPLQDQYLEISTAIQPTSRFFGLGERIPSQGMELLKNGIPLTLWTRDQPAADPDQNNYGAHPNFLEIRPGMPALVPPSAHHQRYP